MKDEGNTRDLANPDGEATYTRREALAAMAKYSAAVGGSAATIVTADGLVSAASAYPEWLSDFCQRRPGHWLCTWDGWDDWENNRNGRSNNGGRGSGRIRL